MYTDIFWTLFDNLALLSGLGLFAYWATGYDLAWWKKVNRMKWIANEFYGKFCLLEIKLPREITRSPQAMELVLDGLYLVAHTPPGKPVLKSYGNFFNKLLKIFTIKEDFHNWWSDTYQKGEIRLWSSLEIESRGGELHFYISCQKKYKEYISALIFSQYPGIEVTDATDNDYTTKIRPEHSGGDHSIWTAFVNAEDGKQLKDYLMIKTYIDYGLDKDPKDEHKVDPLVPWLETISNIKPDEHFWVQILVRASINTKWKKDGQDRMDKIMGIKRHEKDDKEKHIHKGDIESQNREVTKLPPKEKEELDLIQRKLSKIGFDCHIKTIYIAPKGKIRPEADQIVRNAFKSFNSEHFNKFKMKNQNSTQPWHEWDPVYKHREKRRRGIQFFLYASRIGFYKETDTDATPYADLYNRWKDYGFAEGRNKFSGDFKSYFTDVGNIDTETNALNGQQYVGFVLNAEELATIFHFPSKNFTAPKFARVESTKSEPPMNLPV